MPNISQKSLLNLMIPLPGFDEQKRFEKLALKVYENKKSTNDSLNNINELYQSILQRAFSGNLNFNDLESKFEKYEINSEVGVAAEGEGVYK